MRLAVARFNEDLSWLSAVPEDWEVFVYNKGEPVEPPRPCTVVARPNVGREAETFCYHNASVSPVGWTAFVQGNPFDHFHDPIEHIKQIAARGDRVGWLGFHYDTDWNVPPHTLAALDFRQVWDALKIGSFCPTKLIFPAGAQMVVHESAIKSRDHLWWQLALEVSTTEDWRVAHCFERLWPVIYS